MPSSFTFRRFCRKGYAAFASMHRQVRIGVLSVAMLASVNLPKVEAMQPSVSHASDDEADERALDEVTVAGTISPLTALQAARIVGVISRQQIEASAAQSVSDLLKIAVGMDVRQRGGFGVQTDISVNGCTFDQITLLLNGVNISSPHTGHLSADFPVSLADIERIEILEGAASRVYGASAFGGAINIVTKGAGEASAHFEAGLQGGSYGTVGADAHVSLQSSKKFASSFSGRVGGEAVRSDGATPNSDFRRSTTFLRGLCDAEDYRLDLQAGYSEKAYGANTFYSAAYPNQWEQNRRFIFSLGAESKGRLRLRPEIYWNRLYDHFQLVRNTSKGENYHRTDVHGVRLTAGLSWKAGRTTLGAELREESICSSSLGVPYQDQNRRYRCHDSRTNLSFNAEHTLLLPRFTLSAGLLAFSTLASVSDQSSSFHLYPGLDLAVRPNSHWRLFASYNKGFRLPTFTDLYYKSPTHEGNQGMRAEESHSFQVGLTTNHQCSLRNHHSSLINHQYTLKAFYHRGTHLIDWVMYSPDDVFHSANFDLDNLGLEASVTIANAPATPLIAGQGRGWLFQLSYAFIHQHRRDDVVIYKSNYAMEYLRHKVVATLTHPVFALPSRMGALSAAWTFRWQDRQGSYIRYEDAQSTGQLVPYSPYATLDLRLRWTARRYEFWAEGTNLTNRRYYDFGNIPQPGIMVLAGARVRLFLLNNEKGGARVGALRKKL